MSLASTNTGACDPANPWLAFSAVVEDVLDETPGVATYRIRILDQDAVRRFRFQPGQFNMLYLPGLGEIAISVSGDPAASCPLPHTIREAGTVTPRLHGWGGVPRWDCAVPSERAGPSRNALARTLSWLRGESGWHRCARWFTRCWLSGSISAT